MKRGARVAQWVAVSVALLLLGGLTGEAGAASGQPSANVVVIPGFAAPHYSGFVGVPAFPSSAPGVDGYNFSQLAAGAVTPAALASFDTVVLYGLRWSDLSAGAQAAINEFAQTGKVVIWDSDATGSQDYSSFVHPFSTTASGEVMVAKRGSVVTFPTGTNPLASPDPANPLYLAPSALTASNDLMEDMSVLAPGSPDWSPGLIAANQSIPNGGWVLAWAYGSTANQTGMTIYSGMDADAFSEPVTPNYAQKELAIELAALFQRAPVAGCAPNCAPPPPTTTGGGVPGGSASTFARCSFARRPPVSWVRSRVSLFLETSVASGGRGQVLTRAGKVVAPGVPMPTGDVKLVVNTRLLASNRTSTLLAVVSVNAVRACSVSTRLKVDNTPPKLLDLKLGHDGSRRLLTLETNEAVTVSIRAGARTLRTKHVRARTSATLTLPSGQQPETLVLSDRARNRTTRNLG